jgi:hypothetical protein
MLSSGHYADRRAQRIEQTCVQRGISMRTLYLTLVLLVAGLLFLGDRAGFTQVNAAGRQALFPGSSVPDQLPAREAIHKIVRVRHSRDDEPWRLSGRHGVTCNTRPPSRAAKSDAMRLRTIARLADAAKMTAVLASLKPLVEVNND